MSVSTPTGWITLAPGAYRFWRPVWLVSLTSGTTQAFGYVSGVVQTADMGPELLPRRRREAWVEPALGGGESPGAALLTVEGPAVEARNALYAGRDAELLARFAAFWPRGMAGPPSMPWLGGLVDRTGAYLWAAEFRDVLQAVSPSDHDRVRDFVFASVVATSSRVQEAKRRRYRRPDRPPPPPLDPTLPDQGDCSGEPDHWSCIGCPPGRGTHVWVWPDCQTQQDGPSCSPTDDCPGTGPIQPDPWSADGDPGLGRDG